MSPLQTESLAVEKAQERMFRETWDSMEERFRMITCSLPAEMKTRSSRYTVDSSLSITVTSPLSGVPRSRDEGWSYLPYRSQVHHVSYRIPCPFSNPSFRPPYLFHAETGQDISQLLGNCRNLQDSPTRELPIFTVSYQDLLSFSHATAVPTADRLCPLSQPVP